MSALINLMKRRSKLDQEPLFDVRIRRGTSLYEHVPSHDW